MKQLFSLLIIIVAHIAYTQSPQSIPYQAVVRNTDGSVLSNTLITMTFKIHDVSATGTVVYEETHTTASNAQGLVALNVGGGTPITGTFNTINWSNGAKFLHVLMNAGNGVIDLGTQQMMSVPYALFSEDVNVRVSLTGDSLIIGEHVSIVPGISPPYSNGYYTEGSGVTDIDGNFYKSVIIGSQEWMADNLKTTKFCNGIEILPYDFNVYYWWSPSQPHWSYPNMYGSNNIVFGKLYNGYAVLGLDGIQIGNICPCGWHVPSIDEFIVLKNYVISFGYTSPEVGVTLKDKGIVENGTGHWLYSSNISSTPADNTFGFSALPAGTIQVITPSSPPFASPLFFGKYALFWSSTPINATSNSKMKSASLDWSSNYFSIDNLGSERYSLKSIRCIKD